MKQIVVLITLLFLSCASTKPEGPCTDCPSGNRTGARCKDGTTSNATGSGACSHHGGVQCWFCE